MADIVQTGLEWLNGKRALHRSVTITYRRGAYSVSITTATHEYKTFRVSSEYGMTVTEERDDFMFEASKLILNSETVLPDAGDIIEQTIGSTTHKYKVSRREIEQGCYKFSDNLRKFLRVFALRSGTV